MSFGVPGKILEEYNLRNNRLGLVRRYLPFDFRRQAP